MIQIKSALGARFFNIVRVLCVKVLLNPTSGAKILIHLCCCADLRASASRCANPAISSLDFSGFCGDTSHQTSSSRNLRRANCAINRCPSCAGLKDPPIKPIRRWRRSWNRVGTSCRHAPPASGRSDLAIAPDHIFETCQLCCPHRATCMHPACRNTDFGAHTKFPTIRKLG